MYEVLPWGGGGGGGGGGGENKRASLYWPTQSNQPQPTNPNQQTQTIHRIFITLNLPLQASKFETAGRAITVQLPCNFEIARHAGNLPYCVVRCERTYMTAFYPFNQNICWSTTRTDFNEITYRKFSKSLQYVYLFKPENSEYLISICTCIPCMGFNANSDLVCGVFHTLYTDSAVPDDVHILMSMVIVQVVIIENSSHYWCPIMDFSRDVKNCEKLF